MKAGGKTLAALAAGAPVLGMVGLIAVTGILGGHEPDPSVAGLKAGAVPEAYAPLFTQHGTRCPAVDPPLLAAQAKAESGFDPSATSPAGAQGLTQFMPATWAAHGVDGNGDGTADPFNPADAVASQAEYDCHLADLVSEVPGNPTENMLAAYNAGPYAVMQYQGIPPYEETQAYVARILQFRQELTAPAEPPVVEASEGMYARVTWRGHQMDAYTMTALQDAERRLGFPLVVTQGSYSTGVSASAGTHDGGGVVDLSAYNHEQVVLVLRQVGFAAWYRSPYEGDWPAHIHAVQLGHAKLSPEASEQVVSYLNGGDGLAGDGVDTGPRVPPATFAWPAP